MREEFLRKFPYTLDVGELESIADWWLEKRSQDLARLKGEVEKLHQPELENISIEGRSSIAGHNAALSAVLEVIERETTIPPRE